MTERALSDLYDTPADDPLEAALEAACESLIELQLIYAAARYDLSLSGHTSRAIGSLRTVLAQLRTARRADASPVAYGFVVACENGFGRLTSAHRSVEAVTNGVYSRLDATRQPELGQDA
jgi:hypothetical protein